MKKYKPFKGCALSSRRFASNGESEHKMGEYAGFLVILAFSGCAYGKHLKFAKAHEYWDLEAHP